jgi:hypothetical protein
MTVKPSIKPAVATKTICICTGAKTCRMDKCLHYRPHVWTEACEGGCFDGAVCREVH